MRDTTQRAARLPYAALIALAGAVFVSITAEFLPAGLMPEMAAGLGVSESRIGLLVSIFAAVVVISGPPLAALSRRVSRKRLLLIVMAVFAVGLWVTALAPSYGLVVVGRVIGAVAHALFWSVVAAYTAHLVPKEQINRAVSIVLGGGSAAFVLGIPLGTALGHLVGWRLAFAIVGGAVVVLALLVLVFVPAVQHLIPLTTGEIPLPLRADRTIVPVLWICAVTAVIMIAQYTTYTYIAPILIDTVGIDPALLSVLLLVYGVAGIGGLLLASRVGDRFPRRGVAAAVVAMMLGIGAIALWPGKFVLVVIALVIWGVAMGMLPVLLQSQLLHAASARIRDIASAWYTSGFNLGIGLGALLGALVLDAVGLAALPPVTELIWVISLMLIAVSVGVSGRRAR